MHTFESVAAFEQSIEARLPPVLQGEPIGETCYYGAAHLISRALGLDKPPMSMEAAWQHGVVLPPLWGLGEPEPPFPPNESNYPFANYKKSVARLVIHREQESFLESLGCERAVAVGLPYLYTMDPGLQRIPGSLLAMPAHSFNGESHHDFGRIDAYMTYLKTWAGQFPHICVCLYGDDYDVLEVRNRYHAAGFAVVRGASINDMNALQRMRCLFESFEAMTTNDFGSHTAYASFTGCPASIGGPSIFEDKGLTVAKHPYYFDRPVLLECVLRHSSPEYLRSTWPWLYEEPGRAVANVEWAAWMLGKANQRPPLEIANYLGWKHPFDSPPSSEGYRRYAGAHNWSSGRLEQQVSKLEEKLAKLNAKAAKAGARASRLEELQSSLAWRLVGRHLHSVEKRLGRLFSRR